jgi:hypothetical protein
MSEIETFLKCRERPVVLPVLWTSIVRTYWSVDAGLASRGLPGAIDASDGLAIV